MENTLKTDKQVRRIILIEGTANCIVLTLKVIVGLSTGSMAILADAFHSLTDIANNIVAWVVIYFSSQPADREHPYGHRKFETIAVFILASLLLVIAFEISLNAIRKEPSEVGSSGVELLVMLTVLVVNILLASWQRMWANRLDSDIIRADATHTFSDALTTCVVIVGWQLSAMGYVWADRLGAIAVSLVIVYLAFGLFKRSVPVLVDGFAIDPEELINAVAKVKGVEDTYKVRSRWIGKSCSIDLIIAVDPALSTHDSHLIADEVETLLERKFGATDVSIHVEPKISSSTVNKEQS